MKTLKDHTIIYDHECPMCHVYTGAFVKYGLLEKDGRKSFGELDQQEKDQLDLSRSFNEIPLINTKSGEITYGIESLFKILVHRFPVFQGLFKWTVFRWFIQRLYSFISYNRKVIIPGSQFERSDSCAPTFNLKYRVLYLVFSWIVTAVILTQFSLLISPIVPSANIWREVAIAGGQMIVLGLIAFAFDPSKVMYYLGNLMTVSLMGALMLIPITTIGLVFDLSIWIHLGYFSLVVLAMFIEHKRRLKILELPALILSLSWVTYRAVVLLLII
ncbi:MAG: hypothetical protein NXI20_07980 [bacterium]|nr:hypothetical protein [bacterium]